MDTTVRADDRLTNYIERNLNAGYRFDPTRNNGWFGWTCYGQGGGFTYGNTITDLERRLPKYLARLVRECSGDEIADSREFSNGSIWRIFYEASKTPGI